MISEEEIMLNPHKYNLNYIVKNIKLKESTLSEIASQVDLDIILKYQKLSANFIIANFIEENKTTRREKDIDINDIKLYQNHLTKEEIEEIKNKLNL